MNTCNFSGWYHAAMFNGDRGPDVDESHTQSGRARVVLLTNPMPHTMATATVLIDRGVNLVGILSAQETKLGLPLPQYMRALRRNGYLRTAHKALGQLAYGAINARRNRSFYKTEFDHQRIAKTLSLTSVPVVDCVKYSDPDAMAWLESARPDVLVVHSESWVTKKVRELSSSGLVIGGHPGRTPHYRGGHSMFWALHNGHPEDLMWTVFHVDQGVDTGDVIAQGPVPVMNGDTFDTLNWRGMQCIARAQADVISGYDAGSPVPRTPHAEIPEGSLYGLPTLAEYVRYRRRQNIAR
jgi:hypothetical protein